MSVAETERLNAIATLAYVKGVLDMSAEVDSEVYASYEAILNTFILGEDIIFEKNER